MDSRQADRSTRAVAVRRWGIRAAAVGCAASVLLTLCTIAGMRALPRRLTPGTEGLHHLQFLDRHGWPLQVTYQNDWNYFDYVPLHETPPLLRDAFIYAEDARFFQHGGVDWRARWAAAWQDLTHLHVVRGASTISEQVVRMLHPRPRTFWSRWIEGFEASRLEKRFSKAAILEFYLNQVPYTRNRRGVVQAARDYFDRELDTLSPKETLALAVLVRAPSGLDPARNRTALEKRIAILKQRMVVAGRLTASAARALDASPLQLGEFKLPVTAAHFVSYLKRQNDIAASANDGRVTTTLDSGLQQRVSEILETRVYDLRHRHVSDGAVLVVDHRDDQVLAWVNAGGYSNKFGSQIDAVVTPRQPGSALKPFLYALALERGWTAATLIDDAPIAEAVGRGLHEFHNYSRRYYGPVRLRTALGNSLNIPAIRTVDYVGRESFYQQLRKLGFDSLTQHPDYYGDGLALGNGEVTLFDMVQAYASLARQGVWRPLRLTLLQPVGPARRVYSTEAASLIGDILSDPQARALEFGRGSLLRFPIQTAVKTGTATDYRDAWAIGFSDRYTVGVWMGNLDRTPMKEITGALGPGLVLRSVFAELYRNRESAPLKLSPRLQSVRICRATGERACNDCPSMDEWFTPNHLPAACTDSTVAAFRSRDAKNVQLMQPTPGLELAVDPRIPKTLETFTFRVHAPRPPSKVEWFVDNALTATTGAGQDEYPWHLARGAHLVQARVWVNAKTPRDTYRVRFYVK